MNERNGGAQVRPPLDTLQEFKIQTSSYSAEYGRLAGGVVNTELKTGGNQLHGGLFEFLRNDLFDARTFFAPDRPKLRRNQFGANLSGPVWIPRVYNGRDRSFFLFGWESFREVTGEVRLARVPTALERQGDFSQTRDTGGNLIPLKDPLSGGTCVAPGQAGCFPGNRIPANRLNPIAAQVLAFFPVPNRPVQLNNYLVNLDNTHVWDSFVYKFDLSCFFSGQRFVPSPDTPQRPAQSLSGKQSGQLRQHHRRALVPVRANLQLLVHTHAPE